MKKRIGVYIHFPFCIKKCDYCDFLSFPIGGKDEIGDAEAVHGMSRVQGQADSIKERYLEVLFEEIRQSRGLLREYEADTVFIGGGTPSLLSGEELERLLCQLRDSVVLAEGAELTMEMNPGTVRREQLAAYRRAGINRVSVGLQSACDKELRLLGRIHTFEEFAYSYDMLRAAGFDNINIDVMSALPGQDMESYARTLEKVMSLSPEHISAYSLIVEPGTPFYDRYGTGAGQEELPDEETDRQMYAYTGEFLKSCGYHRYEISNYALPGRECRHNLKYWQMEEYIGFGLGSASLFEGKRLKNTEHMKSYLCGEERERAREETPLTEKDEMEEFMFLGLRLTSGVCAGDFFDRFGVRLEDVYGKVIQRYMGCGLLSFDRSLRLTERGMDVSNTVMADFLL